MFVWCLISWNIWFFLNELMFRQWKAKNINFFSLIDLIFCNRRKILMIYSSSSWTLRARQMMSDLLQWIFSSDCFRDISWRFSISLRTSCIETYIQRQHFFQYDFMIVRTMRSENIECFFIKDIQKFMIFNWKNVLDHDVRFIMLFKMFFYVFQNNEKQIYVLSLIHYIERWCLYHRDVHFWQFLFRVKDFELIKIESEIFNRFRIFDFVDWFCRFFVFSKKINRWLIRINFFSKKNFDNDHREFSRVFNRIVKFEVIWLIQKRFLFEMNVFFFVCCFYSSRMRAKFKRKFDDIRFVVIIDFVLLHSRFVKYQSLLIKLDDQHKNEIFDVSLNDYF